MAFGKEIKRLRVAAKLSAEKLAKAMGVDPARLRKWEERDSNPKDDDQIKIETYFGLPLDEIGKLKEIPKIVRGKDANSQILQRLVAIESKINVLFSDRAEEIAKASGQKPTDVLREMNTAVRLETDTLLDLIRKG